MLKNNRIVFLFLILLVIALLIIYFGKKEKSFKENLVVIDSTEVNIIEIFPKSESGKKIYLKKSKTNWKVKLESGLFVSVPYDKIQNIFTQLINLKPLRIIGRGMELFSKYQIDETATHIKFWNKNDLLADVYLGKFFFTQPRNISSSVRLANEDIIYEVENILSMQFDQNENYYRNNNLIVEDYSTWNKLVFIYPNDSSYQLTKRNNKWFVENTPADSGKVRNYIMSIQRISSSDFININSHNELISLKKLLIIKQDNSQIEMDLQILDKQLAIKSSMNTEAVFNAIKSGLDKKIFVNKEYFLKY